MESELDMVHRHVRQGAEQILRQRDLLARLRENFQSTEAAEALLLTFEGIQQQHEAHLIRILGELSKQDKTNFCK